MLIVELWFKGFLIILNCYSYNTKITVLDKQKVYIRAVNE